MDGLRRASMEEFPKMAGMGGGIDTELTVDGKPRVDLDGSLKYRNSAAIGMEKKLKEEAKASKEKLDAAQSLLEKASKTKEDAKAALDAIKKRDPKKVKEEWATTYKTASDEVVKLTKDLEVSQKDFDSRSKKLDAHRIKSDAAAEAKANAAAREVEAKRIDKEVRVKAAKGKEADLSENFPQVYKELKSSLRDFETMHANLNSSAIGGDRSQFEDARRALTLGEERTKLAFGKVESDPEGKNYLSKHGSVAYMLQPATLSKELLEQGRKEAPDAYTNRLFTYLKTAGQTPGDKEGSVARVVEEILTRTPGLKDSAGPGRLDFVRDQIHSGNSTAANSAMRDELGKVMSSSGSPVAVASPTTAAQTAALVKDYSKIRKEMEAADSRVGGLVRGISNRVLMYGGMSFALYGVMGMVKGAIDTMGRFETSVTNVTKVMNPLMTSTSKIGREARDMAKEMGQSTIEAANSMSVYAQQGNSMSEVINLARTSMLAANVAEMDATQATEALTAATMQFGIEQSRAMHILDSWNEIENRTAVTAKTLADAIKQSGTSAKVAGISFNQLNGMVSAVGSATRRTGNEIGHAFKYMIANIRTDKAVNSLQSVGVASFNAEGQFRSVYDILGDLAKGWEKLDSV